MKTLQKIREGFAYFRMSTKHSLIFEEEYYWIVKLEGMQGVAIEISADQYVNEKFSTISYYTKEYVVNGQERHLLMLVSNNSKLHDDFAYICAGFLEKVLDAESYQEIQQNPISWWHAMKELMGNANIEKAPYSVLAEMLSYYYLLKQGKEVSWVGPFGGTVDVTSEEESYEIKSTVARYGATITINSQYQLKANYLWFYRFEPATSGVSILEMIDRLVELGVDETILESALEKLNYPVGSEVRKKTYRLLEAIKYEVNEQFPKITLDSFVGGKLPQHITSLTYTLDLDGLDGEAINVKDYL